MGENIEKHVKCDAGSLARCFPDIPFKDIRYAAAQRMAFSVLALHVAAHNCHYYIVKYQCKSLEQLQNLVTQRAVGIQRLEAQEKEALAPGAERWTSKQKTQGHYQAPERCESMSLVLFNGVGNIYAH